MQEKMKYIETKDKKYPLVFNLNVMELIQEEYETIEKWGKLTDGKESEVNIKALKFGITEMINEGIDIENNNKPEEEKMQFLTKKEVGRIITELGMEKLSKQVQETVVNSTKIEVEEKKRVIHEEKDDDYTIDFSWLLFIGHCLLGFSEKEVGRMTLSKLLKLYQHYKNNYDFKLANIKYSELEEKMNHRGELFQD